MEKDAPVRRRSSGDGADVIATSRRLNDSKTQSQYEPYKQAGGDSSTIGIPLSSARSLRKIRLRSSDLRHSDRSSKSKRKGLCPERSVYPQRS